MVMLSALLALYARNLLTKYQLRGDFGLFIILSKTNCWTHSIIAGNLRHYDVQAESQ